jgi:hypothetical protein
MPKTKGCKNGVHGAGKIDKKRFERLCGIMCTELEICDIFDVSHDTMNRWCHDTYGKTFEEAWRMFTAGGKVSLRRAQFQQARKYPAMAIWLGKQYLGQSDKVETESYDAIEVIDDVED